MMWWQEGGGNPVNFLKIKTVYTAQKSINGGPNIVVYKISFNQEIKLKKKKVLYVFRF